MAWRRGSSARRRLIAACLAAALGALPAAGGAQDATQAPGGTAQPEGQAVSQAAGQAPEQAEVSFAVVSRERLLREATAARRLREAEEMLTARLQREIDETKAVFAAEEAELARIRDEMPEAEFETRVVAFDQRVRQARRLAQERAAVLQKSFQDARAAIVAALPGVIERLRIEAGASVVLNGDQVLALDPALDLTERAIALFDEMGPSVEPPRIDFGPPLSAVPERPAGAPAGEDAAAPPSLPLPGAPVQ